MLGTALVPPELIHFLARDLTRHWRRSCQTPGACALFPVNVDADALEEYVVILSSNTDTYVLRGYDRHDDGSWHRLGAFRGGKAHPSRRELFEALQLRPAETVAAPYRDLKIGATVFQAPRQ